MKKNKKPNKVEIAKLYRLTAEAYLEKNMTPDEKLEMEIDGKMEHVITIAASIMMTRDKFLIGGGFVENFVKNDLRGAIGRADRVCIKCFRVFQLVLDNCYIPRHQFEIEIEP